MAGKVVETVGNAIKAGIALHRQGRGAEAARVYQEVLAADPENADALHFLGVLKHQEGDSAASIELIERAIASDPGHPGMRSNLGNVFKEMGRVREAERAYRTVLELTPEFADAHCNLGVVLRAQKKLPEAAASLQKAVALDSGHGAAHYNLGHVFSDQRDWESAIVHFRRALECDEKGEVGSSATQYLAAALRRAERIEEAVSVLREWLEREPEHPIARHMLAATSGEDVPARASNDYVRVTFDRFASSFDSVLDTLHYQAPRLVAARFEQFAAEFVGKPVVLDAACGTGLAGELIKPLVKQLVGVDLSTKMLARAAHRKVYDELVVAELTSYLGQTDARFDAITCVDSLVYFGDLTGVLGASSRVLHPGGFFCFTLEKCREEIGRPGFELQMHGRYRHTQTYVRQSLQDAGFTRIRLEDMHARVEAGVPVDSLLVSSYVGAGDLP